MMSLLRRRGTLAAIFYIFIIVITFLTLSYYGSSQCLFSPSQQTSGQLESVKTLDHLTQKDVDHNKHSDVLLPFLKTAPDTIHMIWCGRKWFEFKHYLALVSLLKVQQPNKVIIHYWENEPILRDTNNYNLWFDEISDVYYNVVLYKLGSFAPDCMNDTAMMSHLMDIMKDGGIYVNDTVILNHHLHSLRTQNVVVGLRDKKAGIRFNNIAFMVSKKISNLTKSLHRPEKIVYCDTSDDWEMAQSEPLPEAVCLSVLRNYVPEKIMTTNDSMSRKIRSLYYGSEEPRVPLWSMDDPIPNIGHMVLLGGHEMNMLTYLSIRSMIHCVGAEYMYIYIDKEPTGVWYEKLKREESRAVFVYHEWPETVFGNHISDGSHASDLLRFDFLYRYGGIYVDWDAVMLKPLGDLRGYGFVTDFDWPDWHPPYPDVINNGVSAGKKGSKFLWKCLMKFKDYKADRDWYYNGLMVPYKLYERHPELVKIERKLQVICFNLKCHPVWLPGYHNEKIHHLNQASFDWREVYAFHWTRPSPPELLDMDLLMKSTTMFAEVGRYILSCDRNKLLGNSTN